MQGTEKVGARANVCERKGFPGKGYGAFQQKDSHPKFIPLQTQSVRGPARQRGAYVIWLNFTGSLSKSTVPSPLFAASCK